MRLLPAALTATFLTIASLVLLLAFVAPQANAAGWTTAAAGSSQLNDVHFADATTGFATGVGGTYKTTNGGSSWTRVNVVAGYSVNFASSTVGWVGGNSAGGSGPAVWKTTTGGSSWTSSDTLWYMYSLDSASTTRAWAVGSQQSRYSSTDGSSFSLVASGTGASLHAVDFASTSIGWAVGDGGVILKCTDGSGTWSTQTSGTTNNLYGVSAVSTTVAYASGAGGTILKTTDGGTTWTAQTSGTTNELRDIHFVTSTVGWAVGASGTVLYTDNGGTTWTTQTSGTTAPLYGVHAYDTAAAWAVGAGGTVLYTTDGGGTPPSIATLTSSTHPSQSTWYQSNGPAFAWTSSNPGGTTGYSYILDQTAGTTPDTTSEGTGTSTTFTDKANGTWYFHVRALSAAGWGPASQYTVKIDATAPGAVGSLTSSTHASQTTWYANNTPAFTWTAATDATSGIAGYSYVLDQTSNTTPDTTSEGAGLTKTYTAQADGTWYFHVRAIDNAGNGGATTHYTVKIDTVAPGVINSLASSTHASQTTWYSNNDPAFSWTASSDATSGIKGYSYVLDQTSGTTPDTTTEGTGLSASFTDKADGTWYFHIRSVDNAGSGGTTSHYTVKIDATVPGVMNNLASSTHPTQGTWYTNNTPAFSWTASSDATSGIAGYSYILDQTSGTVPDTTSEGSALSKTYTAQADGIYYFHIRSIDNAGNGGTTTQFAVKIDTSPPGAVGSLSSSTHPVQANWYANNDPAFSWTAATDVGAGVTGYSYVLDQTAGTTPDATVDGAAQNASFTDKADGTWYFHVRAVDSLGYAGTTTHYTVKIDTSGPGAVGSLSSSTHPVQANWYANNDPAFSWTAASDAGSGVAGYSYVLDQAADTIPDATTEGAGLTASFTDRADGTWYFHVRSVDAAGNGGTTSHYTVKIDTTVPGAVGSLASSTHPTQTAWYSNTDPAFSWTAATDAGSGIAGYSYCLIDQAMIIPDMSVEGTGLSTDFKGQSDGTWYFKVRAVDNMGNGGPTSTYTVRIDATDPVTAATGLQASADTGWADGPQLVTLSATDATSGVAATSYRIDGGALQTYTGAFSVSGIGSHTVTYYSTDNAGNVEALNTGYVNIKGDAAATGPGWFRQNPLPTPNLLLGTDFLDASTGYAVGFAGTILKTTDGGVNWQTQDSGTTSESLYGVCFTDASHGWATGDGGIILATSDGGETWSAQSSDTLKLLRGVSFIDASHGWAVGSRGTILATSDGGQSWSTQSSGTSSDLYDVSFADASHGWATGYMGTILATSDGGATWSAQDSGTMARLWRVCFTDAGHGWAVGTGGTILSTSDSGATWSPQTSGVTTELLDVFFADADHGWVSGSAGELLATSNGGASWSAQSSGTTESLHSVGAGDATHATAVGWGGTIVNTADGGSTWTVRSVSVTREQLSDASFIDASRGWAVGTLGAIVTSADGGETWSAQSSNSTQNLLAVQFVDAESGWAVGDAGTILATGDGGATWGAQSSPTSDGLTGLRFVDASHGWTVGASGTILATANGGSTWTAQTSGTTNSLHAVDFVDATHGWAVGAGGIILVTSNGGSTWSAQSSGVTTQLCGVDFADASHGWAVGNAGTIVTTSNGGSTWTVRSSNTADDLRAVHSVDGETGWAVGNYGTILKTSDGGLTWSAQDSGATEDLYGVEFVDEKVGWALGYDGAILATTVGGGLDTTAPSAIGGLASSTHPVEADWYAETAPSFSWDAATDADSGIDGYSYVLDQNADTVPDTTVDGTELSKSYAAQSDGVYYFHIRAVDNLGNAGPTSHHTVRIDTSGPGAVGDLASSTHPVESSWYAETAPAFSWSAATDGGSGVAGYSYILDQTSDTTPDTTTEGAGLSASFTDKADGTWYFHVRAVDALGTGGTTSHYTVRIDTSAPGAVSDLASSTHPVEANWYAETAPAFNWSAATDGGSGVAGYSYTLDQTADTTPDATSEGAETTKSFAAQSDGVYYFHVRAVDNLGNAGPTAHYTVRIDITPPVTTDDAPSGTQESAVTVHFEAGDAHSAVAHTYYTVNGGLSQEGTSVEVSDLGTTELTYWSVDALGNTETAHVVSVTIGLSGSLSINNGASSTSVERVLLHSIVARAAEMRFSNDGSTWSEWESYAPVKVWTLTSGAGAKTVQAQYRTGATTLDLSDTIALDATYPGGMMQINNGASSTTDLAVTLTNSVTGATEMRFRDAGGTWTEWEAFAVTKSWTLPSGGEAAKTVEAEYRDAELDVLAAGDSIVLDANAPTGTMAIASGGPYAKAAAVTLNMSISGATEMRFRDDGGTWSDWEPYAASKSWTIAGADGLKLVEGQFRDAQSDLLDCPDAVTLDTHGPETPLDVTASWVRLSGNNGRVSAHYRGIESSPLSPLVVTAAVKTSTGVTRKTATYTGDSLDTVISRSISTTLTKGSYRLVIGMADEAGNTAAEAVTVTFSVR